MSRKSTHSPQVEEILESLNGIEKAEPRPFFFTRLQARMARESDPSVFGRAISVFSRPAVVMATLLVFLLVNGYFLFNRMSPSQPATEEVTYQALAVEYTNLNAPALYDSNH